MKAITEYEIHIFGMNRCGQHAILAWLLGMFDNVLYKNDMGKGTFIIDPIFMHNNEKMDVWKYYYYQNYGKNVQRKEWEVFSPEYKMDAIILGSENAYVEGFADNYSSLFCEKAIPEVLKLYNGDVDTFSKKKIFIPVIRSPHNHAASCLKWRGVKHFINQPKNFISLWKSYAEEYLGDTNHMSKIPNSVTIPISYDHWFSDEEYRKNAFNKMDIDVEYSEKNLNSVLGFGKGSSFGRGSNNAQKMDVLNRWKYWMDVTKNNQHYLNMLNDPNLLQLSEKIYGEMPFIVKGM